MNRLYNEETKLCVSKLSRNPLLSSTSPFSFLLSVTLLAISPDPVLALIDCGASTCFISPQLIVTAPHLIEELPEPLSLHLFDGSIASTGHIKHFVDTTMTFDNGDQQEQAFLVTRLHPTAQVVLGMTWLQEFNPQIDWKSMTLTFPANTADPLPLTTAPKVRPDFEDNIESDDPAEMEIHVINKLAPWTLPIPTALAEPPVHLETTETTAKSSSLDSSSQPTAPLTTETTLPPPPQPPPQIPLDNTLKTTTRSKGLPSANAWKFPHLKKPPPNTANNPPNHDNHSTPSQQSSSAQPKPAPQPVKPKIQLIGAAPFATLINTRMATVYGTLNFKPVAQSATSEPAENTKTAAENIEECLPREYRDFADVFSEEEAKTLPPHRTYDHGIELEPDSKAPWGPLYNMSELELTTLREFLDDMLGKGFIRSSTSPAGAPVLFARKKDGSLRLCVDYRGLNRVTIKNRYPIPLVNNIMDRLRNAKVYSKIDLRAGYHNVRIKDGQEWMTAFRTRYGSFEYLVMPFGLTNAPASFQYFMNDIFADMVDVFVVIYLDDILIYSDNLDEHRTHVRKVLQRLRDHNLHAHPKKSEFHCDSIEYLGFIVSPSGISMDPAKTEVILSWPAPTTVKEVQSFLGFANFYRRFIYNYSKITRPLNNLTRKDTKFVWNANCQTAFDNLKTAFTSAPILAHYDPENPIVVETDSSDYAIAAVMSQLNRHTGVLHPVAFYSRSMQPAELNYDIYDKELLAIFEAFRQWRAYLKGVHQTTLVVSDHNNLEYFTTTKQLSRRQARWSEYLSNFDFIVKYRPGRLGTKPDALTRRPDVYPKGGGRAYAQANPQNRLPIFRTEQLFASTIIDLGSLAYRIRNALEHDEYSKNHLERIRTFAEPDPEDPFSISDDGLLLRNNLIYVPDHDNLRLEILRMHHDHRLSGHPGIRKTIQLIQRRYFWPRIRHFVTAYIRTCTGCIRAKSHHHKPYGFLKFLPVPHRPWSSISMDFIEGLPLSDGYDCILVIVDRLTKGALFIECNATDDAPKLALLYLKHVFSKHGVPHDIISDRGKLFVSKFWSSLCKLLGIKSNLSTAYHPETDGQTERVNQSLEMYIRIYCNYQQDDWVPLLPLAEFAYNNTPHSATHVSPFFANKGYHPRLEIGVDQVSSYAAQQIAEDLAALHEYLKEQIRIAINQYSAATSSRRTDPPKFKEGAMVWLNARNIKTKRPSKKLDHRYLGPYKIVKKISSHAFRLQLPDSMKLLHPVFHVSLLEPAHQNTIPHRRQPPPPPVEIDENPEYEVSAILDSRKYRNRIQYLVEWAGYEDTPEHQTWEPASNLSNAAEYIRDFHKRYPNKPRA